jgi:lipid II:glycine glycyltransferase (peptidoglycan interpeptide bridge formation enzyme)
VPLDVRPISRDKHLAYIKSLPSASFLQAPCWAEVKADWTSESLGWFEPGDDEPIGVGLVLYRQIPRLKRFLAYLPEGPVVDWFAHDPGALTKPLLGHLKNRGAFSVKMGPQLVVRRWHADTVKDAIASGGVKRLSDVLPDVTDDRALEVGDRLRALGWQQEVSEGAGFGDVQPRYVFQVPLADRSLSDIQSGFNQLWRRNIKKAEKAGVEVVVGGYDDLPAFHEVYLETAERDRFTGRPLSYFQRMYRAMTEEDPDRIRLYLARHEGRVLAATTWVRVGDHVWYSYGASTNEGREHRPSNAIQWRMMADAQEAGARVYDLRGISDTLDPDDHLFGLIQFKLGTGGQAVEYLGEWDYPLNPLVHKAFQVYMKRR